MQRPFHANTRAASSISSLLPSRQKLSWISEARIIHLGALQRQFRKQRLSDLSLTSMAAVFGTRVSCPTMEITRISVNALQARPLHGNHNVSFGRKQPKLQFTPDHRKPSKLPRVCMSVAVSTEALSNDTLFLDYKASHAFMFPGQGAQAVGMGKDAAKVPVALEMFNTASEILGYDLLDVCINGPKEKLDSTVISQPAIYVASMAALESLRADSKGQDIIDSVDVTCGLSLGEYTALAFAGVFSFEDGLKLVKLRGEAMQAAADSTQGSMASVIGLDSEKVQALCDAANEGLSEDEKVQIANYLCTGNYVVSGGIKGVEAVEAKAKSFKARMVVRLAVAGAFHTRLMGSAVPKLEAALAATTFKIPRIPVISNVDAKPHSDPSVLKTILSQQVTSPVQWETTLRTILGKGLQTSYELGPGKVIAGLLKRIDKSASIENISV